MTDEPTHIPNRPTPGPHRREHATAEARRQKIRRRLVTIAQLSPSLVILCIIIALIATNEELQRRLFNADPTGHVSEFSAIESTLRERFYLSDVDDDAIFTAGMDAMVGALGDPYTTYMDDEEFQRTQQRSSGEYAGLGIQLSQSPAGELVIVTPFPDSPAMEAGLRPGDVIVRIDGEDPAGVPFREVVSTMLAGEPGSTVDLTLRRGDETVEATVGRRQVRTPGILGARMIDADAGIGYLRIKSWQGGIADDFLATVEPLRDAGLTTLILDLRFNRGGRLHEVPELAGHFLPADTEVVYTRDKSGGTQSLRSPATPGALRDLGLIVLVNGDSASASEIFAGAMRDYRRALLVGERTYGKGLVQSIIDLGETGLRVTTSRFYTPSGRVIQRALRARVDPETGVRYPTSFSFSPTTGNRLEDAVDDASYRGGIPVDVQVPIGTEEQVLLSLWLAEQEVWGGPPVRIGASAALDRIDFTDRQLAAAVELAQGNAPPDRDAPLPAPDDWIAATRPETD
jgi:carboxyl-terminal processing protease